MPVQRRCFCSGVGYGIGLYVENRGNPYSWVSQSNDLWTSGYVFKSTRFGLQETSPTSCHQIDGGIDNGPGRVRSHPRSSNCLEMRASGTVAFVYAWLRLRSCLHSAARRPKRTSSSACGVGLNTLVRSMTSFRRSRRSAAVKGVGRLAS